MGGEGWQWLYRFIVVLVELLLYLLNAHPSYHVDPALQLAVHRRWLNALRSLGDVKTEPQSHPGALARGRGEIEETTRHGHGSGGEEAYAQACQVRSRLMKAVRETLSLVVSVILLGTSAY